jgi:DNA-binding protein HU-beta
MNKTDLIDAVATRSNTTKAQTATMLNGLLDVIQKSLADGDNVQLVGFGTFSITERASREGRNPATGKTMTIPAKKVVKFKPGKTLSDAATADNSKPVVNTGKPVNKTAKKK